MATTYRTPLNTADFRVPRRRRTRKSRSMDLEKVQRDFWLHFDLEKFASDWRRGLGKRA